MERSRCPHESWWGAYWRGGGNSSTQRSLTLGEACLTSQRLFRHQTGRSSQNKSWCAANASLHRLPLAALKALILYTGSRGMSLRWYRHAGPCKTGVSHPGDQPSTVGVCVTGVKYSQGKEGNSESPSPSRVTKGSPRKEWIRTPSKQYAIEVKRCVTVRPKVLAMLRW